MFALLALVAAAAAPPVDGAGPDHVAADGLRILVVAPAAPSARVEALYSGLREAGLQPVELEERAGVDLDASTGEGAAVGPGVRDDARAHLQQARALFRDLDIDGSRSALERAIDEILRLERPEDARETLVDTLLLRASIALQEGVDDEAHAALTLVARLEPLRAELHPGLYAPSLVQAYADTRAKERDARHGSLVVRPRVAGFAAPELVIDGSTAHAPAPGVPLSLPVGPHLVTLRARADGAVGAESGVVVASSQIIDIGAAPVALEPFLGPADAPQRRAALVEQAAAAVSDDVRASALGALASLCAARAALYVDDTTASLWLSGNPKLATLGVPSTSDASRIGRATLAAMQAPTTPTDAAVVAPVEEPVSTVTVVSAAAVGLAIVVVGIGVGVYTLTPAAVVKRPPPPVIPVCCVQ